MWLSPLSGSRLAEEIGSAAAKSLLQRKHSSKRRRAFIKIRGYYDEKRLLWDAYKPAKHKGKKEVWVEVICGLDYLNLAGARPEDGDLFQPRHGGYGSNAAALEAIRYAAANMMAPRPHWKWSLGY